MARAVFSSVCLIVSLLAVRSDTTNAPIVVGSFDDTFHQAESACVANVLQQRGYNATLLVGNHTISYQRLWDGGIDFLPSA